MSDSDNDAGTLHSATGGGVSATHASEDSIELLVAPSTAAEFNKARLRPIPIACWRVDDIRFAFDSSFVAPEVAKEVPHLAALRDQHKRMDPQAGQIQFPPISLFGHADPVGNDSYNKFLSGRRAAAIYAMLVRRTDIWEDLFSNTGIFTRPIFGDKWGNPALQVMRDKTGKPAGTSRPALFAAYMEFLCTPRDPEGNPLLDSTGTPIPPLKLSAKTDFLGQAADHNGKGDYQGCGEFNPFLIFSQKDNAAFEQSQDKKKRNDANAPNRRVMALLFRPGSRVDPVKWPCPLAKDDVPKCIKRFFSDGEKRRSLRLPDQSREFSKTKDTFACRFYDRLSNTSPCEGALGDGLLFMQCFDGDGIKVLAGRKYTIRGNGNPAILFKGVLDKNGALRHELVPNGNYVLTVQGCSEDSPMAVLEVSETIPQIRMLENGRLGIRAVTPQNEPIVNAMVQVQGLGQRLTDEDGLAYFGTVPDGDFTFQVSKDGFEPLKSQTLSSGKGVSDTVSEAGGGGAEGDAVVKEKRTDAAVTLVPTKKPVVATVVQINARQVGSLGTNPPKKQLPHFTPLPPLPASTSPSSDLIANPPVVLIRGSHPVRLTADTNPPGQVVTWQVIPNQSPGPAPNIDPKQTLGNGTIEAELSTAATGSFSVQAQVGSSVVIWNLVLVGVDIDPASPITLLQSGFQDFNKSITGPDGRKGSGLLPTDSFDPSVVTAVATGKFEFGKHAWSSEVRVSLKGGGTSGTLGCDQVEVQILQNMVADNSAGVYQTQIAFPDLGTPANLLDTGAGSPPGYAGPPVAFVVDPATKLAQPQSPFLFSTGMFQLVKNDPAARILKVGDSPSVGYATKLSGEPLTLIRGTSEFRTAVASFSKHSKNSIVAHADTVWRVDYTGDVSVNSGIGEWSKTSAQVIKVQGWQPITSLNGVQGNDVGSSLLEIFPPRAAEFNDLSKKKVIPKP
jgi:hypothetical protein